MQAHNGEATKGEYRVKLPDGRVQIVTYTADNGGYRADIRYDKGETQTARPADNTHRPSGSSGDKSGSTHPILFSSNNFSPANKQQMVEKQDSALLYFNEIRTFDPPVRGKAASYETVEHVDEEPFPYSKKLLADVNYLLKYVTPTVEMQTENVFDITPDHKALENRRLLPQNANSNEQQSGQTLQKIPYKLLKIEDLKFDHPILNSPKYDKSKFDSLPPVTAIPLKLNLTARLDPAHAYGLQYSTPKEPARYVPSYEKYVPSYETGGLPQLITPKYILKFDDPPSSTPNYESLERPQFNTPIYQPAADPPQSRGQQFVRARYEPKPSITPGYEHQNPSTQRDQPQYIPTFRSPIQETTPFVPRDRYVPQNHDSSPRYVPQRVQTSRQEKPILELPVNSGERFNEIQVSVYHAPGFEPLNLKNPQFQPSPSPPRLYLRPALPLPPFNDQRYVSKESGASPHFRPEDYPAIPQSAKTTSQPEAFNSARDSPPVSAAPGFNSQEFPPVTAAPNYNPKDFPPVTAAPIQDSHEQINNFPATPQFGPTSPGTDDRRPSGEDHFGKIEIPQYLHIHRYEESGENAKPKELIYYTPLHISVPNSLAYMEHGSRNTTGPYTPSYVTMTEHPRLLTNTDTDFFHDRQPENEQPHPVTSEGRPSPTPLDSNENFHSSNQGTTPHRESEELSHWRPSSPTTPTGQGDHSPEQPEHYEKPMSDFDARIYSGYFDFIPTSDTESASKPVAEDSREAPLAKPSPESPSESSQSTPLPQYYYDYSTATPTHRYISAEVESHETNLIPEEDQIRNSSFRSSAYLRPLRKERVYIHHNALPTTTANDPFISKERSPKPYKDANVSIVKSISSSIPPELLKDFDLQLRSSTFRRDNSKSGNEITETKVLPPTLNPKLKELIAKKLQAAIPTAGKVYLKTAAQQKRNVR